MPQIHHKSSSCDTEADWKLQERCGALMEIYFFCRGIGLSSCGELFHLSPAQPSQTSYCPPLYEMHQGREEPSPAPHWILWAEEREFTEPVQQHSLGMAQTPQHPRGGPFIPTTTSSGWPFYPKNTAFTQL